jgi:hypothetical protein
MKKIITILPALFCVLVLKAQLFENKDLYPGTAAVKSRYFNGSGGKGYWSLRKLDAAGRTVEYCNYKNRQLLYKDLYRYNSQNDITCIIHAFYINKPGKVDTTTFEYAYAGSRIVYQKRIFPNRDSVVFKLADNKNDSVLTYQCISYNYPPGNMPVSVEKTYVLHYADSLLTKQAVVNSDSREVTDYEYYSNGKLKRRIIQRTPALKGAVYTGAPGSDDQSYKYTYDPTGRVKNLYTIVNDKTYKLAHHNYITR